MPSFNKVILMGNLTRDPQLSYLPSQMPVVELSLAINRNWTSQDGQKREEVCFVDCKAFGKQAETLSKYMSKGRPLLIEGHLQLSNWEDKEGNKRSKMRVVIERFTFVGGGQGGQGGQGGGQDGGQGGQGGGQDGGQGGGQGGGYQQQGQQQAPAGQDNQAPPASAPEPPYDEFSQGGGDEIPF